MTTVLNHLKPEEIYFCNTHVDVRKKQCVFYVLTLLN